MEHRVEGHLWQEVRKWREKAKVKSSDSTPVVAVSRGRPNTETELFDDYFRSETAKNNAMTILLGNKNTKVLLEIEKLESERC